jgi:hypothetical protein
VRAERERERDTDASCHRVRSRGEGDGRDAPSRSTCAQERGGTRTRRPRCAVVTFGVCAGEGGRRTGRIVITTFPLNPETGCAQEREREREGRGRKHERVVVRRVVVVAFGVCAGEGGEGRDADASFSSLLACAREEGRVVVVASGVRAGEREEGRQMGRGRDEDGDVQCKIK